ncbi:hypothetical protein ACHAWC_006126 [Mediolabrus comicus]
MVERPDYDALADDINLEDITSSERNENILRMLRDDYPNWNKRLYLLDEYIEYDHDEFVVGEGDDFGWLGYFIGKCLRIENLYIRYLPEGGDEINSFFEGMTQNRSIEQLCISTDIGSSASWSRLGNFFENNRNLSHFEVRAHLIGNESAHNIASALGQMDHTFLRDLRIRDSGISDEGMAEIAAALGSQSQLERLFLDNNNMGRNSCIALGNTLSRWPASNRLKILYIDCNAIDDEGLQALVSGVMNCCSLKHLYLGDNPLITAAGLRYLTPLLQSESHSLDVLRVTRINWGDDGAMALAEGLAGNDSLVELRFRPSTAGMTSIGWSAFSRLLCDTSTINNTYLSNHTLTRVGCKDYEETPEDIQNYLRANNRLGRKDAAIYKILRSHPDLDMEPFFKLKLQFLPAFDRVEPIEEELIEDERIEYSERSCQSRKLSALYKFVRAMPDLATAGYWEGRMIHIEAETRRIANERRRLDVEERRLEYEKKVTLERLGDQPMDEDEVNRNKRMRHE